MFGKKKPKDEVKKQRTKKAKVPWKKCGHKRSYKGDGGSTITVICSQNRNVSHRHD